MLATVIYAAMPWTGTSDAAAAAALVLPSGIADFAWFAVDPIKGIKDHTMTLMN